MRGQIRIPITPECTRGRIHAAWPDRGALVEEIACVIWRKRRLRLAEAGSYQHGIAQVAETLTDTIPALKVAFRPIIDIVSATAMTARDLAVFERRDVLPRALEILKEEQPGAYKAAFAELDDQTRTSWQERLAPRAQKKKGW